MAWAQAIGVGLQLAGGLLGHSAEKKAAKAKAAWQAYSNTMTRLVQGVQQNVITTNQLASEDAFANQAIGIKRELMTSSASAAAEAAAAGVSGRSVTMVMNDIARGAAEAERDRQIRRTYANLDFAQQRTNSVMQAEMAQDRSLIQKPSVLGSLLGTASGVYGQLDKGAGFEANSKALFSWLKGS